MNLQESDSPVQAALQKDIGIANRAKKRFAVWGAVAVVSAGVFVARETIDEWNLSNEKVDIEQVVDLLIVAYVSGAMTANYEIYSDAKGRIAYRQQMIERSQSPED